MNSKFQLSKIFVLPLLLLIAVAIPYEGWSQDNNAQRVKRDSLLFAARQIMKNAHFCTLITVDTAGRPDARIMDPFPPEEDMKVWLATNPKSRKVKQIGRDSRVALFYFDHEGIGYVNLTGVARLVGDDAEKALRWKKGWETFYPDRDKNYLLIEVTPKKLEINSAKYGFNGDPDTWAAPVVEFNRKK